jgi:hypothetical protein
MVKTALWFDSLERHVEVAGGAPTHIGVHLHRLAWLAKCHIALGIL